MGNTYSDPSLVNFALAGLATSKNPKYDTAVQLYNLVRDGGKLYTLEDIEKKFFSIDEKISRDVASAHIAQGNWPPAKEEITIVIIVTIPGILVAPDTAKLRTPHKQTPQLTQTVMQIQPVIIVERKGI